MNRISKSLLVGAVALFAVLTGVAEASGGDTSTHKHCPTGTFHVQFDQPGSHYGFTVTKESNSRWSWTYTGNWQIEQVRVYAGGWHANASTDPGVLDTKTLGLTNHHGKGDPISHVDFCKREIQPTTTTTAPIPMTTTTVEQPTTTTVPETTTTTEAPPEETTTTTAPPVDPEPTTTTTAPDLCDPDNSDHECDPETPTPPDPEVPPVDSEDPPAPDPAPGPETLPKTGRSVLGVILGGVAALILGWHLIRISETR